MRNHTIGRKRTKNTRGQAMTEYIIIVSLVAIGCLMVVGAFGRQIANLFKRSTNSLNTGSVEMAAFMDPNEFTGINQSGGGQLEVGPITVVSGGS
ncbi:MAG: hypothetical protein HYZ53_16705 [Planctomycetes bacterium]|nr:hypothetical protein [Planctomycetota bacterium]